MAADGAKTALICGASSGSTSSSTRTRLRKSRVVREVTLTRSRIPSLDRFANEAMPASREVPTTVYPLPRSSLAR